MRHLGSAPEMAIMKAVIASRTERSGDPQESRFRRILVGVKFSTEDEAVLACAAELAIRCDASLMLVHVVEPSFPRRTTGQPPRETTRSGLEDYAEAKLELSTLGRQMLGKCRVVETSIRNGLAFFEITESAQALGADLIVIGAGGGYTSLSETAQKIIRHAPCPVLVV